MSDYNTPPPDLKTGALKYAQLGRSVFAVWGIKTIRNNGSLKRVCACPLGEKCAHPGKHPHGGFSPNGLKSATLDLAIIEKWWTHVPDLNVGLPTGDGILVLDVDQHNPAKDGEESLSKLERELGPLPKTVEVVTGSGGRHLYFRVPKNTSIPSSSGNWPGLDVRCQGGYVIAPPSQHVSGARYEYEADHHPEDGAEIAELPPAWVSFLSNWKKDRTSKNGDGPSDIPKGQRNDALTRLAGKMRHAGATVDELEDALLAFNKSRCKPPLEKTEVLKIAESVGRYETEAAAPALSNAMLSFRKLLGLEVPKRKRLLPWLPEGGQAMIYSPRGTGKTMLGLGIALALANGEAFLSWPISEKVSVLYVDGEMALDDIRKRTVDLATVPPESLTLLSSEYFFHVTGIDLSLTPATMREALLSYLTDSPDIKVVIFDNISCLFGGMDEDKKGDWEPIANWLRKLRHRGIATVLIHHSGKSGQQRGTSGREDALDTVIHLKTPEGYRQSEGCHFEVHFTKSRSAKGTDVGSLDVKLEDKNGVAVWTWQTIEAATVDKVRDLIADGVTSVSDIASELGISKGYASKVKKQVEREMNL